MGTRTQLGGHDEAAGPCLDPSASSTALAPFRPRVGPLVAAPSLGCDPRVLSMRAALCDPLILPDSADSGHRKEPPEGPKMSTPRGPNRGPRGVLISTISEARRPMGQQ